MTPEEASQDGASHSPRIIRIVVRKLFGSLDHDIALGQKARVTIIHGINGVGKTKLLELTAAVMQGRLDLLPQVRFKSLSLDLDDGTSIVVEQNAHVVDQTAQTALSSRAKRPHGSARNRGSQKKITVRRIHTATGESIRELPPDIIARVLNRKPERLAFPPWISRLGDGSWFDERTDEVLSEAELLERYGLPPVFMGLVKTPPEFQREYREVVPCTRAHLIETQRLLRRSRNKGILSFEDSGSMSVAVRDIAEELRGKISDVQNEFFRKDQELARTLTERVLKATGQDDSEGLALRQRLEALQVHRERLERVGLLETGRLGPTFAPAQAESVRGDKALMIAVHTDDTEQKFRILDPLARRLELFLVGMNEKLARPKKLLLTPERELVVERGNERISLENLSSGEQHELVLLYDLAFRIKPNTLVLIDEPELSLHPTWQQQFLDDLLKLAENGAFDAIVATHSPYIIGNRNDLCVELLPEVRE